MKGQVLVNTTNICNLFQIRVHSLIAEDGNQPIILGLAFILLDNHFRNIEKKNMAWRIGLLTCCHNPLFAIHGDYVGGSKVRHINVSQSRKAREQEDVVDIDQSLRCKFLVHNGINLFISKEATIHSLGLEVDVEKWVVIEDSSLSTKYNNSLESL